MLDFEFEPDSWYYRHFTIKMEKEQQVFSKKFYDRSNVKSSIWLWIYKHELSAKLTQSFEALA